MNFCWVFHHRSAGESADGEPEIARAVLFFASDDSRFVNAQNLIVDGGFLLV